MWKGRFTEETHETVRRFTQSLDVDWRLAAADIRGSVAHVRMLAHIGLLTSEEARTLEEHLFAIGGDIDAGILVPKESLEDVHMNIEAALIERCGSLGAKLHAGRSRNDQVATTMRLFLREALLDAWGHLEILLETLQQKAGEHRDVVVPGYTHLQQAQPISMGQYWMAYFWAFLRDAERLLAAYHSCDACPLGAGALAGSTLPLDREFTARDLGFSRITENSMDSVAQRDYLLDVHYFFVSFGLHASRLAEDLIIYSSTEFGWIELPDAFCTGSSIMPQKKNPDVLELLRGRAGQFVGHMTDLMVSVKGLPLTYNRDLQEDKRGLWASFEAYFQILSVLPNLLARVGVSAEKARRGFSDGFIFATDVAEYLVGRGIPFREAHEKVGRLVRWCVEEKRALTGLSPDEWRRLLPEAEVDLPGLLVPETSVERRKTLGGTSPEQVRWQQEQGMSALNGLREMFQGKKETLSGKAGERNV